MSLTYPGITSKREKREKPVGNSRDKHRPVPPLRRIPQPVVPLLCVRIRPLKVPRHEHPRRPSHG